MSFNQGRVAAPTNTNMKDSTIEINMEDLIDVFPVKRKAIREINERVGGFEEIFLEFVEDGAITEYVNKLELYFFGKSYSEPEEKKEKVKEIIREVFAEAGLEIKELKRGDYATLFTIEGKLII
jgi:hypothetical protein